MKVFLSSASFDLKYGGPAYSVFNLAKHLAARGIDVAIWSPDGTAFIASKIWGSEGDIEKAFSGNIRRAIEDFGIPDIFHDSGLWWRHNFSISSLAHSLCRPLVISTRGMLEPPAIQYHKLRKRIAWHIYQKRILANASALHVTGDVEALNVKALKLPTRIFCISNGVDIPEQHNSPLLVNPKRLAFLGRIHPIKGLSMLLEAWARVKPLDWILEIAGPDDISYKNELEKQIQSLGIRNTVSFIGTVYGDAKEKLFMRASAFVLPSLSENFGIAAGEALAWGIPVLATYGAPLAFLNSEECGWHVETSVTGLEGGLKKMFATSDEELFMMGLRGRAYVTQNFSWPNIADQMIELYKSIYLNH